MERNRTNHFQDAQAGAALLIALFVLLLISVVGFSLVLASGTETALTGYYRNSTGTYYAALAGLEEARGRLLPKNPDYFNNTVPSFIPAVLSVGDARYIVNPAKGENVLAVYPDNEFPTEFGGSPRNVPAPTVNSVSGNNTQGLPGPLFKWVRINAVTEKSLNIDVNHDGALDAVTPLYYDPANTDALGKLHPSLVVPPTPTAPPASPTAVQAYEITSLAVLPNGLNGNLTERLLQYVVAPVRLNLTFPSALTMAGNPSTFPYSSASFQINGNDQASPTNPPIPCDSCPCGSVSPSIYALGVTNSTDATTITAALDGENNNNNNQGGGRHHPQPRHQNPQQQEPSRADNFTGENSFTPNVYPAPLPLNFQNIASVNTVVQTIEKNADIVINGPATQANLPASMSFSATNPNPTPMTIAVNGNLSLSNSFTGYGLLLVTGSLTISGDSGWNGIVLVIGQGSVTETNGSGGGGINGAIFVANTSNPANFGPASFNASNTNSNGIGYNSRVINCALQLLSFQVLSFHEITQQQ